MKVHASCIGDIDKRFNSVGGRESRYSVGGGESGYLKGMKIVVLDSLIYAILPEGSFPPGL